MAGGKDIYTVKLSDANPGRWAVAKNGAEMPDKNNYRHKYQARGAALRLNTKAHGG